MSKRPNIRKMKPSGASPKEYKGGTRVINLGGYNIPNIEEVKTKEWVSYTIGDDNEEYFDYVLKRYLGSPTNSTCINGISDMIFGRGIDALDSSENPKMYSDMKLLLKDNELKKIVNDFKLFGQASAQIIYNSAKNKIVDVLHFPIETLRAEQAQDGSVKAYYYHPCWRDYKPSDKPKRIPTFKNGAKSDKVEVYIFKPYKAGFYYNPPTDYHGCLQYCHLEEEVSNYHINNIQQGLQPSLLFNFNNGIPPEEAQELIERRIADKFGGSSNSGKFVLQFNESAEFQSTIEPIHLPDAHAQYQFLSDEAREKIMLGHRIVSPILLGIKDNTGFGNNAEELRTASIIMDNTVIRPHQQEIIRGLNQILSFNNIYLKLYFVTLQPIEFTELDNIGTKVRREEETGEKLSATFVEDFSDEEGDDLISQLEDLGEVVSDEWEIVHREKVTDDNLEFDLSSVKRNDASPSKKSAQDNSGYKIRYAYMPVRNAGNSREFCKAMETFTSRDIVFRKEDINMMSFRGINRELGHKKRNYSLFKFKGGKNCHHYFERRVFRKKTRVEESDANSKGFVSPTNPEEVPIRPVDMPNRGAYPIKNK